MKKFITMMVGVILSGAVAESCQQSGAKSINPTPEKGLVTGKVTDARGNPLKNVSIELSHTVWSDKKLTAQTDVNGSYSVTLPAEPRGNWTIQARHNTNAYGKQYQFILDASDNSSFGGARGAIRNFSWKLTGEHIGGQYGAAIDIYSLDGGIPLEDVKLIFTPTEEFLVDGTEARSLEKILENVDGKYRARFIPVGKYLVQAIFKGKPLKLSADKNSSTAVESAEVVFTANESLPGVAFHAELFVRK